MSFEILYVSMIAIGGPNFAGRCINDFVHSVIIRSDAGDSLSDINSEGPLAALYTVMVRAKRPIWEATKSTTAGNI
jgi:hypothetical protein